jgi:tetratricopeptide (TPR) repeat protein
MGRPLEASYLNRVLELHEDLGDRVQAAMTLHNLGVLASFASRWDEGADYFLRAAEAAAHCGNLASAAIAKANLAETRANQGRLAEAEALLVPALRTLQSCGYSQMVAYTTMHLGRTKWFLGEADSGEELLRTAIAIFDDIGAPVDGVEARARLAEALLSGGRLQEARQVLEQARAREDAVAESPVAALLDRVQMTIAAASGDDEEVRSTLDGVLERARAVGATYDLLVDVVAAGHLGVIGDLDEARQLSRQLGIVNLPMLPWT